MARASCRKSRARALLCLPRLDIAVTCRRVGVQRGQEPPRGIAHLDHRAIERLGIGLRRPGEA
jgi:hypothetical protein